MNQQEENTIIKALSHGTVDMSHVRMIGDEKFWDALQEQFGPVKGELVEIPIEDIP